MQAYTWQIMNKEGKMFRKYARLFHNDDDEGLCETKMNIKKPKKYIYPLFSFKCKIYETMDDCGREEYRICIRISRQRYAYNYSF